MPGVANVEEFLPTDLVPRGKVRVAAFDGALFDGGFLDEFGEGVAAALLREGLGQEGEQGGLGFAGDRISVDQA